MSGTGVDKVEIPMDDWMTLQQVADRVHSLAGQKVTRVRVWHWCHTGVRGVRMRHARLGRNLVVRPAALNEFLLAVETKEAEEPDEPRVNPCGRPPLLDKASKRRVSEAKRARQISEARENLRRQGIG
jgi:hypothetical protein